MDVYAGLSIGGKKREPRVPEILVFFSSDGVSLPRRLTKLLYFVLSDHSSMEEWIRAKLSRIALSIFYLNNSQREDHRDTVTFPLICKKRKKEVYHVFSVIVTELFTPVANIYLCRN